MFIGAPLNKGGDRRHETLQFTPAARLETSLRAAKAARAGRVERGGPSQGLVPVTPGSATTASWDWLAWLPHSFRERWPFWRSLADRRASEKSPAIHKGTTGPLEARAGWGAEEARASSTNHPIAAGLTQAQGARGTFWRPNCHDRSRAKMKIIGSSWPTRKKGPAAFAGGANEREGLGEGASRAS